MSVEEQAKLLRARCVTLAESAGDALGWVDAARRGSPAVEQHASSIETAMHQIRNAATRLGDAAGRRMCVGVFGASQAGKSYLVNSLARGDKNAFRVTLGDESFDFLNQINPQNESESTGLVSRFSSKHQTLDPDHPVGLRLLGETDIVKILINSFQCDINHEQTDAFPPPDAETIMAALKKAEPKAGDRAPHRPTPVAIHDLKEYVVGHFTKSYQHITASPYWDDVARLAPRLSLSDRADLYAFLWSGSADFSRLFMLLAEACQALNYAPEACCGIDALLQSKAGAGDWQRHERSILNVTTLFRLGTDTEDMLEICPIEGGDVKPAVSLPRSLVTALTAELQLGLGGDCYPFFENADLLDFPGVRGRLRVLSFEEGGRDTDKDGAVHGVDAGANFLLRGKVEYLFQRYEAERELSAMLLCVASSNQEVSVLGEMVNGWVKRTLGATPEGRADNPNTLFFIMTKFDNEFGETTGQDENSQRKRFDARIQEGLLKWWQRHDWPDNWDGAPFRNSFWLRNPAYLRRDIMEIDDDKREVGVLSGVTDFIATMRGYCVNSPLIQNHMADPGRAFDEAMRPNDGGVGYIVEKLTEICQPDLKVRQIQARFGEEFARFDKTLRRFFDDAGADDRGARGEEAAKLMRELRACVGKSRFGELLASLQLSIDDIQPIHAAVGATTDAEISEPDAEPEIEDSAFDMDDIFGGIDGDAGMDEDKPVEEKPKRPAAGNDRAARFASAVLQAWTEEIYRLPTSQPVCRRLFVKPEILDGVAQELAKGSERLDMRAEMAAAVRAETSHANAQWDVVAPRAVAIAHRMLSNYITWLGQDRLSEGGRVKAANTGQAVFLPPPEIDEGLNLPDEFAKSQMLAAGYIRDWITAYRQLAVDNAGFSGGGVLSVEDNDRLGAILRKAKEGATA